MNLQQATDEMLRDTFTAAVKTYAARAGSTTAPAELVEKDAVTATEAITAICALMYASDLNPFDVAMWYRRPLPEVQA